jgi:hypothetical protein
LETELWKELSPQHSLFNKTVKAIARRIDCDDVFFELQDDGRRVAVVHLTWSGKEETDPRWPHAVFFASRNDFAGSRMKGDCEDYTL